MMARAPTHRPLRTSSRRNNNTTSSNSNKTAIDYSKWDKLAAELSSSDGHPEGEESETQESSDDPTEGEQEGSSEMHPAEAIFRAAMAHVKISGGKPSPSKRKSGASPTTTATAAGVRIQSSATARKPQRTASSPSVKSAASSPSATSSSSTLSVHMIDPHQLFSSAHNSVDLSKLFSLDQQDDSPTSQLSMAVLQRLAQGALQAAFQQQGVSSATSQEEMQERARVYLQSVLREATMEKNEKSEGNKKEKANEKKSKPVEKPNTSSSNNNAKPAEKVTKPTEKGTTEKVSTPSEKRRASEKPKSSPSATAMSPLELAAALPQEPLPALPATLPASLQSSSRTLTRVKTLDREALPQIYGFAPHLNVLNILPTLAWETSTESDSDDEGDDEMEIKASAAFSEAAMKVRLPLSDSSDDEEHSNILTPLHSFTRLPRGNGRRGSRIVAHVMRSLGLGSLGVGHSQDSNMPSTVNPAPPSLLSSLFVLHVRLRGISPPIWRRVAVPARISLAALHEKILLPLFHWEKAMSETQQTYLFNLPRSAYPFSRPHRSRDVSFGPLLQGHLLSDWALRRLWRGGWAVCDAGRVSLADVLRAPGGVLHYCYDLCDAWRCKITLEAVESSLPEDVAWHRLFGVLDGSGEVMEKSKILSPPIKPTTKASKQSKKVEKHPSPPAPPLFSLEVTQKRIKDALLSCPRVRVCSTCGADVADVMAALEMRRARGQSSDNKRPPLSSSLPQAVLMTCSQCRQACYCSVACQRIAWPSHRRVCVPVTSVTLQGVGESESVDVVDTSLDPDENTRNAVKKSVPKKGKKKSGS